MTSHKRFLLGGGGALMPVLVSFLAVDIGAALDNQANLTTGNIIGFTLRYIILFIVGGFVAYLHEDEQKPFKLFELGIAAPALITSLITAQGIAYSTPQNESVELTHLNFSIISAAQAGVAEQPAEKMLVAWGLQDVIDGVSGRAYRKISKPARKKPDSGKVASPKGDTKINKQLPDAQVTPQVQTVRALSVREKRTGQFSPLRIEPKQSKSEIKRLKEKYQEALARARLAEARVEKAKKTIRQLKQKQNK